MSEITRCKRKRRSRQLQLQPQPQPQPQNQNSNTNKFSPLAWCNCINSSCKNGHCACRRLGRTCTSDCVCVGDCDGDDRSSYIPSAEPHCKCAKSRCLKLYCACFKSGARCSARCRCSDCGNSVGGDEEARLRALEHCARNYWYPNKRARAQVQTPPPATFVWTATGMRPCPRHMRGEVSRARHRFELACRLLKDAETETETADSDLDSELAAFLEWTN